MRTPWAAVVVALLLPWVAGPVASAQEIESPAPAPANGDLPRQNAPCSATWLDPNHPVEPTAHLEQLNMEQAWQLSRGVGQTIGIIDTGVAPHARLPLLRGVGDVVLGGDGLEDCDAHGTLVAGLAAARIGDDGFSGIAPEAEVLSVRQSSALFSPAPVVGPSTPSVPDSGSGTLRTLATAIRIAADAGATVINISEVACVPRGVPLDDAALSEALHYAVQERDIVVVAAAGNTDGPCAAGNPSTRSLPSDGATVNAGAELAGSAGSPEAANSAADSWTTTASPAWYDELVLTVGAVDGTGAPAPFSLAGPWVDVAAPGVGLSSLSVTGPGSRGVVPALGNTVVAADGRQSVLEGTSFAAPLVAGVAALIRSRFPELTAAQVRDRIIGTAIGVAPWRGVDLRVGAGVVDPVAALSAPVRPRTERAGAMAPLPVATQPAKNSAAHRWAVMIAAGCASIAATVGLGFAWRRLTQSVRTTSNTVADLPPAGRGP